MDSCSACYANLLPAIRRLEEEGLAKYLKDRVCIGQGFRGKSGELGVGECTGYFRNNVPGCPPDTERSYRYLKEEIALSRLRAGILLTRTENIFDFSNITEKIFTKTKYLRGFFLHEAGFR